jgi:hypothetical protein
MGSDTLTRRRRAAGSAGLLAVLLVACAGLATPTETPEPPTAAPAASAPPSATREPDQGNLYTNDQVGFSLVLPEGWNVIGPEDVQAAGLSYQAYFLGPDATGEGGPGMSRIVIGDATTLTVDAFVRQQCQTCPEHPVEDVTLDGRPAQRVLVGGGGVPFTVEWTFVQLDGRTVGFSLHDFDTLEPLPEVLATVRLP